MYQSVEGRQLCLLSQKITPKFGNPRKAKTLRGVEILVFPVSLEIKGRAIIEEKLKPKEAIYAKTSYLNKGDHVSGIKLWGFASKPIQKKYIKKCSIARTAKHTNQYCYLTDFCFMAVVKGFYEAAVSSHPKDTILLS